MRWSSLEVQTGVALAALEGAFRNTSADRGILLMQEQQHPAADDDLAASLQAQLAPYPADALTAAAPEQAAPSWPPLVLPLMPGQESTAVATLRGDEPSGQVSAASLQLGRKLLEDSAATAGGVQSIGAPREGTTHRAGVAAPQWARVEQRSMVIPADSSATQRLVFAGLLWCTSRMHA